jgi:hypothetical protein
MRRIESSVRVLAMTFAIAITVSGCAGGYAEWGTSPWAPEAVCDRNGGVWRPALNYCEHQIASLGGRSRSPIRETTP